MSTHSYPIIIDVEASGFGRGSYPIEIGYALANNKTFCSLIIPEMNWTHWDSDSEKVHNISREILVEHGRPAREIAEKLNNSLSHKTIYSDGWSFDNSWVGLLFATVEIPQRFKIESIRKLMSEAQSEIWHATKNSIIEEMNATRHRASIDALIIQKTFIRTQELTAEPAL